MVASSDLEAALRRTKSGLDAGEFDQVLIFDDGTGKEVDFDFRGTIEEVIGRIERHPLFAGRPSEDKPRPGPGRPKLGVVSREVSLLPRHWEWLETQPNGISAALRRLVDEARKANAGKDRVRSAVEAASRFMTAMAGNLPGYEEASRALFAHDRKRFEEQIAGWPADVRDHARRLARPSFEPEGEGA